MADVTAAMILHDRSLVALRDAAKRIVDRAGQIGVDLECLGVYPLFTETRLYTGPDRAWLLAPADDDPLVRRGELAIPQSELRVLTRLLRAGLDFPSIYVAHELPADWRDRHPQPSRLSVLRPGSFMSLDPTASERLVGRVPVPARTARAARHVGAGAGAVLKILGLTVPLVGALTGATAAAGGAAFRALTLDPIVFGAWTLNRRTDPGTPAVWFLLAQWLW